jgi:hypothetical protein
MIGGAHAARVALLWLLLAPLAAAAETSFRVESSAGPIALEVQHDGATLRLRLQRPVDLETSKRALDELLAKAFAGHATAELAPLSADSAAAGKQVPFDAIPRLQLERTKP